MLTQQFDLEESTAIAADSPAAGEAALQEPPLCVDLDNTLISTDLLWESLAALARRSPLLLLLVPFWLLRGRAFLKEQLALRVVIDPVLLPYRMELLLFLLEKKATGRSLVLATASNYRLARAVADHVGLFDEVLATDADQNLKGRAKLRTLIARFGEGRFDYIGDAECDLPIWAAARWAYVVGGSRRLVAKARRCAEVKDALASNASTGRSALKLMRPHQWSKNLLLFVPLLLAHRATDLNRLTAVLCAFAAFSCCASAMYVLNDLLDLDADRKHPAKRNRPLAAGLISLPAGLALCLLLGSAGVALSAAGGLPLAFLGILVVYMVVTSAYSFYLKRIALLDVLVLAGLYAHRILAGGLAADVKVSGWLMAFSMFFFVSLAFAKRYSELLRLRGENRTAVDRRGYILEDLELIQALGPSTGCMAILTFCLYVNAGDVLKLYRSPEFLWVICFILFYWIGRVWLLARRRLLNEDPILFAIKDPASYLSGLAVLIVLATAARW